MMDDTAEEGYARADKGSGSNQSHSSRSSFRINSRLLLESGSEMNLRIFEKET